MLLPEGEQRGSLRQHLRSRGAAARGGNNEGGNNKVYPFTAWFTRVLLPEGTTTGICSGVASARFTRVLLPEGNNELHDPVLPHALVHEGAAARGGNNESHDPVSHALVHEGAAARGVNNKRRRVPFTRVLLPEGGNNGPRWSSPASFRFTRMRARGGNNRGQARWRAPGVTVEFTRVLLPEGATQLQAPLPYHLVHEGAAARGGNNLPMRASVGT